MSTGGAQERTPLDIAQDVVRTVGPDLSGEGMLTELLSGQNPTLTLLAREIGTRLLEVYPWPEMPEGMAR